VAFMTKTVYPVIEISERPGIAGQFAEINGCTWSVARLISLSVEQALPVYDAPLAFMDLSESLWGECSPIEIAGHIQAVQDADLSKPIIFSATGALMDGRHRLVKALMQGKATIKAVRFEVDPVPCTEGSPHG